MGVQDLTVQMVVIVVIGVFFASFMDLNLNDYFYH